jgi:hypothetical protein
MYQIHKKRKIRADESSLYAYKVAEHDHNLKYLIGWPGYRTSNNRSGLGYVETQAEWAHMQGLMFRWLVTGKFKTRHPFYLTCLLLFGILNACPILLLFSPDGRLALFQNPLPFLSAILLGTLVLVNGFLSLIKCEKGESITGD